MTVEQCSGVLGGGVAQDHGDVYSKILEVTGIKDRSHIDQTIKACTDKKGGYEINDVINMLLEGATPLPSSEPIVAVSSVSRAVETGDMADVVMESNKSGKGTSPGLCIDLTRGGESDDMERAFAESLKSSQQGILGGQVTREDEEISKVLEQSLAEDTKLGTKRKRGDLWFVDPQNPHERKRDGLWPVGLKNVGNTCWFSAVIQSLFHLPIFRKLVLNFPIPSDMTSYDNDRIRNLLFMKELRHLFALMIGSHRKYVDPSKAVEILKEAFRSVPSNPGTSDSQQDVSEFQHKLLEWLEDAFKTQDPESNPRTNNPMVQLFYGQYLAEGINEGNSFVKNESFGQFPLQVEGFKDIHESLEAAMAQGEIETLTDDNTIKSGQELWFTCLPPVLTFELSRFQFNTKLARPEKIHKKLDFPQRIFMDRYLECNRCVTRRKREEAKKLKDELRDLQSQLDKFIHYGVGSKRFPLQDVLQCTLEFAESQGLSNRSVTTSANTERVTACPIQTATPTHEKNAPAIQEGTPFCGVSSDVEMDSPKSQNSSVMVESPICSPQKSDVTPQGRLPVFSPDQLTPPHSSSSSSKRSPSVTEADRNPIPRYVSPDELRILQTCLRRWRTEVEQDVKELQGHIASREECIEAMYTDEELKKCPYRLHAVLVHEGQAASGHYWAYVFSAKYNKWLKFNDISATEASWEEIQKDGIGGFHNTSAYCVMYVNEGRQDLTTEQTDENGPREGNFDILFGDLEKYVLEDNKKFELEISTWDIEHRRPSSDLTSSVHAGSSQTSGSSSSFAQTYSSTIRCKLSSHHAQLSIRATQDLINRICASSKFTNGGPEAALEEAFQSEIRKRDDYVRKLSVLTPKKDDDRIRDVFVYFLVNMADVNVLRLTLLEKIHSCPPSNHNSEKLIEVATTQMNSLKVDRFNTLEAYQEWHKTYRIFREVAYAFTMGVQAYQAERYNEALSYFVSACLQNNSLTQPAGSTLRGVSSSILGYYRRQCLLKFNDNSLMQFKSEDDVDELFGDMQSSFIPNFGTIVSSPSSYDVEAVEFIRNSWCEMLSDNYSGYSDKKRDKLQSFLVALLEDPKEFPRPFNGRSVSQLRDGDDFISDFERAVDGSMNCWVSAIKEEDNA